MFYIQKNHLRRRKTRFFLFLAAFSVSAFITSLPQASAADKDKAAKTFLPGKNWSFIENRGQLADENHKPLSDIVYYGTQSGVYIYCRHDMISFVFAQTNADESISEASGLHVSNEENEETKAPMVLSLNRCDLKLTNASAACRLIPGDKQDNYENYYNTGNPSQGITMVSSYKMLTYKNIYNNIDLVLYARPSGLKYEFVVNPGGKVSNIQMQWQGLNHLNMCGNGGIVYHLANGIQLSETAPYTYQTSGNGDKSASPAACLSHFTSHGMKTGFSVGVYDKSKPLIIDPSLTWGGYFGQGLEEVRSMSLDASQNVYITGHTVSPTGIATSGAYQTTAGGLGDAFLAKITSTGTLAWATYYGGEKDEIGLGLAADASGNSFLTGVTSSTSGIATSGAYQTNNKAPGNYNAFLASFSAAGLLSWATYFGGTYGDWATAITIDNTDNVFITGPAGSKGIATAGAYLTDIQGGNDAFVAKFSASGSLAWATYYGGPGAEQPNAVCLDPSGNVLITGYTTSRKGIATTGAYQTNPGDTLGKNDAFIAKISANGSSLLWATYVGGLDLDWGIAIKCDAGGNVYMAGKTIGSSLIATSGAYQTSNGGYADAFISKFNASGTLAWATYFGGEGADNINDIELINGGIAVAGTTRSANHIATSGAYQTSFGGELDAFIATFDANGSLSMASYFGGPARDEGYALQVGSAGALYLSGYTESTSGISTPGNFGSAFSNAVQSKYPGNGYLAIFGTIGTGIERPVRENFNLSVSPNPFAEQMQINYILDEPAHVEAVLYDELGRLVYTICSEYKSPGPQLIKINAEELRTVADGTYFLKMNINGRDICRKIIHKKE